jgi:carbon monoxide dehydrogenase subunit G
MFRFKRSIWVNRTQQEVWDYFTEPTNDPKWRGSAISAEWISDPPHGVGSTYRAVDKLMGRTIEDVHEITAWDAPDQSSFKSSSGPLSFEFTATLESKDNGTQLTFSGQAELAGLFKIAEGLASKQMEKQITADMAGFKHVMEGGTR